MSELTLSSSALGQKKQRTTTVVSPTQLVLRRFWRHRLALWSITLLALVILSAAFAFLSPYEPTAQTPKDRLLPPSATNWFGTDDLGRDVLTRTLYGGRISRVVGLLSTDYRDCSVAVDVAGPFVARRVFEFEGARLRVGGASHWCAG